MFGCTSYEVSNSARDPGKVSVCNPMQQSGIDPVPIPPPISRRIRRPDRMPSAANSTDDHEELLQMCCVDPLEPQLRMVHLTGTCRGRPKMDREPANGPADPPPGRSVRRTAQPAGISERTLTPDMTISATTTVPAKSSKRNTEPLRNQLHGHFPSILPFISHLFGV